MVNFRFYQELNDFLPVAERQQDISRVFPDQVPVKHAIESLGVPHTEVELVLVNGQSVDFSHRLSDGDRVSVYPMFEALDISPLLKVRPHPLRETKFLADAHLGRLARYLRLLGFDTRFENDLGDLALVRLSRLEGRVLLTRDRALLMHRDLTHGCYIRADTLLDQIRSLLQRLDLHGQLNAFSRCMSCNGLLLPVDKSRVERRLPAGISREFTDFWQCAGCGKVYWRGSHYAKLQMFIARLGDEFRPLDR